MQALQKEMVEHGLEVDPITHLFIVEAVMEAWHQAGRPADGLIQADQLFRESPMLEHHPILPAIDTR